MIQEYYGWSDNTFLDQCCLLYLVLQKMDVNQSTYKLTHTLRLCASKVESNHCRLLLHGPVQLCSGKTLGYFPWATGYFLRPLHKSKFVHLYYSYARLLQEAWGSHIYPMTTWSWLISFSHGATATPPPHNVALPSSAATSLVLPSPTKDQLQLDANGGGAASSARGRSCNVIRVLWYLFRVRHYDTFQLIPFLHLGHSTSSSTVKSVLFSIVTLGNSWY